MNSITDISLWKLALSFATLAIPIFFLIYYRIKIIRSVIISAIRMTLQLMLIAVYLEWIFKLNNALINAAWVVMMILIGVFTTINRSGLKRKHMLLPLIISGITSVIIIDSFFLGYVLRLEYVFDARYFIPITGMVLGNALNHNIVGLRTYFTSLHEKSELYYFLLTNTGEKKIALRPFIGDAIKQALNPLIATMSVIGLISLPGMMTGQILGGSPPATAIKYQIMIMLAIFVGCTINLFLSIFISNLFVFDGFGRLKEGIIKNSK